MLSALPPIDKLLFDFAAFPITFIVLYWFGRLLKRRQRVDLGITYVLFCLVFAMWLPLVVTHIDVPWRDTAAKHLGAASFLLGVIVFLALLRRYFWEGWFEKNSQVKAPKFLSQLVGLVIVVVAAFSVLSVVYGPSIQGAVLGSTVVVGIVGFAMQDLLGNIIAGIALEIGKPFKPGDWLVVEGGKHAEVVEVNWRSTRLRDNDAIYIDIPNKTIAGATIVNLSYPTREHAIRIVIGFDYGVPPNFVKDCMARATASAPGVLPKPPPKVFLKAFTDFSINYEIKFWIDDESRYNDILDSIKTNVWYEAQRNGIRIPFPIRTLQIEKKKPSAQLGMEVRTSAKKQPFLQLLDPAQTDKLLSSARLQRFGRGERVIEQGADGGSMFMLLHGEASVLVKANGCETQVATLRDGDYFGEMSLLTGEPRSATVVAHTDCEMWEIGKEVLGEILQQNHPLVEALSDLLAKRRLENEGLLASAHPASVMQEKHREYRASFVSKLKSFFEL